MKRFHFRLERVLKLKQQRERLAELRQQQARQVVEAAKAEVARLTEQLRQTAGALGGKLGGAVPASAWVAHYEHSAQLGQALQSAEARVERALRGLHEASAQRTQIAREVESLLYLRRQQWDEHWKDVARAEQVQLDEQGMRRWMAAQAADAPAPGGERS